MLRTTLFILALALTISIVLRGVAKQQTPVDRALAQSAAYLWSQQADDGGWHSGNYAVLRSGQALTPYVLHALLQIPESVFSRPEGGVERALQFIRNHLDTEGALGHADPDIVEYPIYSTAYAAECFAEVGLPMDKLLLNRMLSYIRTAQFGEWGGFLPNAAAYGGWGFDRARTVADPGHMDLAHTRRALSALQLLEDSPTRRDIRKRAQSFLRLVQKHPDAEAKQPSADQSTESKETVPYDGGFYFSPVVLKANKGRTVGEPPCWQSYATATCDGILALLAAGVPAEDQRVVDAVKWLNEHTDLDYPQGVPTDYPEPWGEAIQFYHYSVRAEVYDRLAFPQVRRDQLAAAVLKHKRPDGSFVTSASPLMKEDDPLLCTSLAVIALASCRN